jgi:hypothetical protein
VPPNNLGDVACNVAARANLGIAPLYLAVNDPCLSKLTTAGPASPGAERGAAMYTMHVSNPHVLQIQALYTLDVTVSVTIGQSVITLSSATGPDGNYILPPLPDLTYLGSKITSAALSITNANVLSVNQAAGTITLNGTTFGSTYSGAATLTLFPASYAGNSGLNLPEHWKWYRSISIAGQTITGANSTGTMPGSTITAASGTFPTIDTITGKLIQISMAGGYLYQGQIVSQPDSAGATITVSPPIPAAQQVTSTVEPIWVGEVLFTAADAPNNYVEVPGAGSGGATTNRNFVSQIATYVDPFDVTTVGSATATTSGVGGSASPASALLSEITKGPDSTAAILQAATYIATQNGSLMTGRGAKVGGATYLYVPAGNYFMPTMTSYGDLLQVIACGEGDVFYPKALNLQHGIARCRAPYFGPLFSTNSVDPATNLRESMLNTSAAPVVDFVGDSQEVQFTSGNGIGQTLPMYICAEFKRQNKQKGEAACHYRGIGGTDWSKISPTGPINCTTGSGAGCTTPAASSGIPVQQLSGYTNYAEWYTSTSNTWNSYVCADHPDVIVFEFSNVSGLSLDYGAMVSEIAYTQSSAWASACGSKNPDILFVLNGWQQPGLAASTNYSNSQGGSAYANSLMRGFALGGHYTLANGGKIGVIDEERLFNEWADGFDPVEPPLMTDYTQPGNGTSNGLPFTVGRNLDDFEWGVVELGIPGLTNTNTNTPAQNATEAWAVLNNELDINVSAGAYGTPGNSSNTSYTGAVSTGYPNGLLRLELDSGTGNLAYEYDPYVITTTANCSATAGQSVITCATAQFNFGAEYANFVIPGAGTSGATLTGIVAPSSGVGTAVNAAGTQITLSTPIVTTVSNVAVTLTGPGGVPRTVSSIPAVPCQVVGSTQAILCFNVSAIGPRINVQWMNMTTGPNTLGSDMAVDNLYVPRAVIPFQPTISTPAGSPTVYLSFLSRGAQHGAPSWLYSDHTESQFLPVMTMMDAYGPCLTEDGTTCSYFGPFAGEFSNHRGHYGAAMVDGTAARSLNLSTVVAP